MPPCAVRLKELDEAKERDEAKKERASQNMSLGWLKERGEAKKEIDAWKKELVASQKKVKMVITKVGDAEGLDVPLELPVIDGKLTEMNKAYDVLLMKLKTMKLQGRDNFQK